MAMLLSMKIDVTKIDKKKLFEGKNGAKYCSLTVSINDEPDQYDNDVSVWLEQEKEDRLAKVPRKFLGRGRVFWKSNQEIVETSFENPENSKKDGIGF